VLESDLWKKALLSKRWEKGCHHSAIKERFTANRFFGDQGRSLTMAEGVKKPGIRKGGVSLDQRYRKA